MFGKKKLLKNTEFTSKIVVFKLLKPKKLTTPRKFFVKEKETGYLRFCWMLVSYYLGTYCFLTHRQFHFFKWNIHSISKNAGFYNKTFKNSLHYYYKLFSIIKYNSTLVLQNYSFYKYPSSVFFFDCQNKLLSEKKAKVKKNLHGGGDFKLTNHFLVHRENKFNFFHFLNRPIATFMFSLDFYSDVMLHRRPSYLQKKLDYVFYPNQRIYKRAVFIEKKKNFLTVSQPKKWKIATLLFSTWNVNTLNLSQLSMKPFLLLDKKSKKLKNKKDSSFLKIKTKTIGLFRFLGQFLYRIFLKQPIKSMLTLQFLLATQNFIDDVFESHYLKIKNFEMMFIDMIFYSEFLNGDDFFSIQHTLNLTIPFVFLKEIKNFFLFHERFLSYEYKNDRALFKTVNPYFFLMDWWIDRDPDIWSRNYDKYLTFKNV